MIDKIIKCCEERGISITKLEEESNLGRGTIGKWKNGINTPNLASIKKVAEYLKKPVSYFL